MLSIVVAMSENRVIGRGGSLPWRLPGDLAHFKRITMGRHVIMGRRTFESLDRPLPGRANVVVTRNPSYGPKGVTIAPNLSEAIERAKAVAGEGEEVFILGGAVIYREALPLADRLYITHVHAHIDGDTLFPDFDESQWRMIRESRHEADERNEFGFTICVYERNE